MSTRERICEAMLDLVSANGYDATSLEEVTQWAGVGREEFDRLFDSKEHCTLAVFDEFEAAHERVVREAYEGGGQWPDSLRAAAYAVVQWQIDHPRELRFAAMEMLWASEMAQARREAAFQSYVDMIDAGHELAEDPDSIPPHTAEGVVGAITEMLTKRVTQGEVDLYELVPQLMSIAVRPYLGDEAAAKELTFPAPPRPPSAS